MQKILEDIKTFIAEVIGIIGGIIWGINSNWDYEPIILLSLSILGLLIFIILKIFSSQDDRPIVELELVSDTSFRAAPKMIPNKSPQNAEGYYLQESDGIYFYEIEHKYDLVVRNNSIQNAYNIKIHVPKVHFLKFKNDTNSLEPLTINNPRTIKVRYEIANGMTFSEAEELLRNKLTDELRNNYFIIEYQNEARKTFYSKFTPLKFNETLKKKPNDLENYRVI